LDSSERSLEIYESESKPFGRSYMEWTTIWWQWLGGIPKKRNPACHITSKFCNESQYDPKVWFLAGTFGDSVDTVKRKCTIPHGKAILFPIINYECSFEDEPSIKTDEELEQRCRVEIDKIGDIYASIDGESIDVCKYRVNSGCFTINVPSHNCFGASSGVRTMASDGYWLFIEPPPIGNHILSSFGSCLAGKIKIGCTFKIVIE
jgi:hypothetical protein